MAPSMTAPEFVKEALEEFDKEFPDTSLLCGCWDGDIGGYWKEGKVRDYLSSKLLSAFKLMEKEVKLQEKEENHRQLTRYDNEDWNQAVDEQTKKIADFLG